MMRLLWGKTNQSARNREPVRLVIAWFSDLGVTLLGGLLLLAAVPSFAGGSVESPGLPKRAASVAGFVPPGWVIEQQLPGNFNRDGRADALVLLRMAPTAVEQSPADSSAARLSTPRVIAVLLGTRNGYELSASNGRLVPQVDLNNQEDPMTDSELSVRPGGFDIRIGMTAGGGSYLGAVLHYRFRHQNGCFRLIGFDRRETHRATLDTHDLSVNFLTGAVVLATGNAQSDATRSRRERLAVNPRRCFQDLGSLVDFKPF